MTITHANYSPDGSVTAGPIEGKTAFGITPESRFWPLVEEWVNAGNQITPVAPETPIDPLAQPLDRLRFWLAAASVGVSKWSVRDRIAAMPETTYDEKVAKDEAIAWFEEAKQYRRDDPLLIQLAAAEGISEAELDALWAWAVQSAPEPA